MKQELTGQVTGAFLTNRQDSLVSEQTPYLSVSLEGILGDNHFGYTKPSDSRTPFYPRRTEIRNSRQVSILSQEELDLIAQKMGLPAVQPEWLGANLVFQNIPDLTFLPPATRLFFPEEAVLVVQGENMPCSGPAKIIQSHYVDVPGLVDMFQKQALHLRGLVAWVERAGMIRPRDIFRVVLPEQRLYSIRQEKQH